jgi:hypothetical protein
MNVLGESKVLLAFMKPNDRSRLNVFDMNWQEIIHASCSPLKGCLHASFIMKMIEVVTQVRYEKGTKDIPYTPFWTDPNNPTSKMTRAPAGSDEPPTTDPSHPSSSRGASTPCPMDRGGRGRGCGWGHGLGARLAHGIVALFSMCHDISVDVHQLARLNEKLMRICTTSQFLWVTRFPLVHKMCPFMHLFLRSMNGTGKLMVPLCVCCR